ncbi:MAG: ATP synthase F1 subunit epsilon [Pseudomonadota bacterium]
MTEDSLILEIVGPDQSMLECQVEMVVVPASEGDIGVLPGHSPLISSLRPGSVVIFEAGKATQRFFVSGGFFEVTPTRCKVLANEAYEIDKLDPKHIETKCSNAKDDLSLAREEKEQEKCQNNLDIYEKMLDAYNNPSYKS